MLSSHQTLHSLRHSHTILHIPDTCTQLFQATFTHVKDASSSSSLSWMNTLIHGDTNNCRRHRDISPKTKMNSCNHCFNHFNICILTLPLQIYNMNSHSCIFLCCIPTWRWLKSVWGLPHLCILLYPITVLLLEYTDMRRLTTGIRSEKCVVRWFCRRANVYLHKPR